MRTATQEIELHGQTIAAGDPVFPLLGSANRDPEAYDNPEQFRLDRENQGHHTFGYGIHFCIGAPLGRMEALFAMNALLDRFESIAPGSGVNERTHSPQLRGFHHLFVQFAD